MTLARFPLWVALSVGLAPTTAAAAPSLWELARAPQQGRAERALVRMERVFDGVSQASGDADMMRDFRQGTLVVAEMSGVRALGDPRSCVLLAEALLGIEGQSDEDVQALLSKALSLMEPGDAWLEAEIRPLMALASRQNPAPAQALLTRALDFAWQPALRSVLLRSRADARMALLDVRGSLRDARAAGAAAEGIGQRALASVALSLALERSGDLPAALAELRRARLLASSAASEDEIEDFASVFRPVDTDYVTALRELELAASSDDDSEEQLRHIDASLAAWAIYARSAAPSDPWLGAARGHIRETEQQRSALAKALR